MFRSSMGLVGSAAVPILMVLAGCGSEDISGEYKGHQTVYEDGQSRSIPISMKMETMGGGQQLQGRWFSPEGGQGDLHGQWSGDRIAGATMDVNAEGNAEGAGVAPRQETQGKEDKGDPNDVAPPAPKDEKGKVTPAKAALATLSTQGAPGIAMASSPKPASCMVSFHGDLKFKDGHITGMLEYDSQNPLCPSNVSSRYIDIRKKDQGEDNDKE